MLAVITNPDPQWSLCNTEVCGEKPGISSFPKIVESFCMHGFIVILFIDIF